jgi:hypothetical protein
MLMKINLLTIERFHPGDVLDREQWEPTGDR